MTIPDNVKEKIRALSLKTTQNGASHAEQAAARDMIAKLVKKYEAPRPSTIRPKEEQLPEITYRDALEIFRSRNVKPIIKNEVTEIDWDVIAKRLLERNQQDYFYYLHETHPWWDKREKTKRGMIDRADEKNYVTESDYRLKCFGTLKSLYEETK